MESGSGSANQNINNSENQNQVDIEIDDDVVEVTTTETEEVEGKGTKKRRLSSDVWSTFDMLPLGPDKKQRYKCKKCGSVYICPSKYGTGNLLRHVEKCVRRDTRDIGQLLVTREYGSLSLAANKFDPEKFRELLNAAIIMHNQPFQFVEYEGFRAVFKYLNNEVQVISRNTCKADIVKLYNRERNRIKCMLQSAPGRICFTSDLWTSIVTDGYISLTAHFIDKDWVLQKRILNFSLMPPPHNAVNMSEKIYSLLLEWGIENKVFSMTLDNASSNTAFVGLLISQLNIRKLLICNGDYLHIRCCSHILNLIVQDGLSKIDECIHKIRDSIKYVRGSQARKIKFKECARNMAISCKRSLRQDVPTRWNSTFLMLDSAIYYRRAFCHLELSDSNYTTCPRIDEWEKAEKICKFLSVFYEITLIFSGNNYPTSNLYFPVVAIAHLTLKEKLISDDAFISSMAAKMYDKFKKYLTDFSTILAIACILDPRYKLNSVDFFYKKFYGANSTQFGDLKMKLFNLFDEYASNATLSATMCSPLYRRQRRNDMDRSSILFTNEGQDVFKELDDYENDESVLNAKKTQLELYLEEPKLDRKIALNVLDFWKGNQFRYPELAAMARDILSIPISTVASEAAFSIGGRVIDQYRSTLLPETAETLICTRDWLYGAKAMAIAKYEDMTEDILNVESEKHEGSGPSEFVDSNPNTN